MARRRPIIAGNWKCHQTIPAAKELLKQLRGQLDSVREADLVVCPPFTALSASAAQLQGSPIGLGAQDVFWELQGAFTGEVSAPMLVDVGCRYCIIGHSERRQYFGETDESVRKKVLAVLQQALTPIVCVGETLAEREQGTTFDVIARQLDAVLTSVAAQDAIRMVIAYEPVWAIGTGHTATPSQAQEVHAMIRSKLSERWSREIAETIRIQYGGSVTASNAFSLLQQPDIDGALVGGASLKADAFTAIVKAALESKPEASVVADGAPNS